MALTGGQADDISQAAGLLVGKQAVRVMADKGYDADAWVEQIQQQGTEVVMPARTNRKRARGYDRHSDKERHLVE